MRAEKHTLAAADEGLPASLPWYSTLFFKLQDNTWRTIYARADEPVVIERSYMKGSIVLISDSFLISNEAMKHCPASGASHLVVREPSKHYF